MAIEPAKRTSPAQHRSQADQLFRDVVVNLESHARGMWRYRWRTLVVIWIASLIGWAAVYSMPDVYEANARIFVDTENAIRPLLGNIAASTNVMNEVTVVTREMVSRPNLAEVARSTDLDLRADTAEEFEALLASLQKRIQVRGNRDNIFSITFQDPDRDKAMAVVQSLVSTFVEKSLGAERTESSIAQSFLKKQIADYEARLTEAEDRLAEFRRDNVKFMPGQRGGYYTRLQTGEIALEMTQGKLALAEERRAELLRQLEGEEPVFGIMPATRSGTSDGGFAAVKIRELEMQLDELRLQYTDKHPRIGQILETIELLKKQLEVQRESATASSAGNTPLPANPLDLNPVYQNMRIQLTNTEVEIASLRAEFSQQEGQVNELKTLVDTVPQVEAELGRLNRDYGVVKSNYEQLLAKLETANIGEDVKESIDDVQFRIIDPPFAALKPVGPQRQLFLVVVLIGALGLGGALAFLLDQLHPVYFFSRAVTESTGIPVLGAVSLFMSREVLRDKKKDHLLFAMAVGMLVASFTLVSVFAEQLSPPLRDIMRTVL